MNKHLRVLFIVSASVSDFRMSLAARYLKQSGYYVEVLDRVPYYTLAHFDLIICSRPGVMMCAYLENAYRAGIPVIIDMDDDFMAIPKHNPAYMVVGMGAGDYIQTLRKVMALATVRTFASPILMERYNLEGFIIPNCWDEQNEQWSAPKIHTANFKRGDVVFGWMGSATHIQDFMLLRDSLAQVVVNCENARVFIGGDPEIYNLLGAVPECRKMFMPGLEYGEYPMMYRYCDYIMAPLEDNHFNRAKSDIKLIEAGARGIPWLASPVGAYNNWPGGGWYVNDGGWFDTLFEAASRVGEDRGWEGHAAAIGRTSAIYGQAWLHLVEGLIG